MMKDKSRETVYRTLSEARQFLAQEAPPKLSESDTKANFIEPVIAALDWAGLTSVVREYYVKNSQEFIDYVLKDSGRLILAIEAKALQVDLLDKYGAQLVQYCAVEGIEWAALTNGREIKFFNTYLKGDLAAKLVLRLDLLAFNSDAEFDALFGQLWLLSRESMTTPTGVKTWLEQRRMDQALRSIILNPTSSIIRNLRKLLADEDIRVSSESIAQWFRARFSPDLKLVPGAGHVSAANQVPTHAAKPVGMSSKRNTRGPSIKGTTLAKVRWRQMVEQDVLHIGDTVAIETRDGLKEAQLHDEKGTVTYQGKVLSAGDWASALKGWPSINVYQWLLVRDTAGNLTPLAALREKAAQLIAQSSSTDDGAMNAG